MGMFVSVHEDVDKIH